jgi:para-nitrobenzyl esterase
MRATIPRRALLVLAAGPHFPPVATHSSEIQYLFNQPNAPYAAPLDAVQERLAVTMRAAWAGFVATGRPGTTALRWPTFNASSAIVSLDSPQSQLDQHVSVAHHCGFWAAG